MDYKYQTIPFPVYQRRGDTTLEQVEGLLLGSSLANGARRFYKADHLPQVVALLTSDDPALSWGGWEPTEVFEFAFG